MAEASIRLDIFKGVDRQLKCDQQGFGNRGGKLVKHKPVEKPD